MNTKAKFTELKNAKTLHDFFEALDSTFLINSAFIILLAIILTPFIALFTSYTLFMTTYIQLFGYLGCVVTFFSFLKSKYTTKLSHKEYFNENIIPVFLFIMLLWSIPSCCFSTNPDISLYGSIYRKEGLLMYFAYCGFFGCGYIAAKGNKLHYLFNIFTTIAIILATLMIIDSPTLNVTFNIEQIYSVFYQKNHAGYYFCMATILTAVEVIKTDLHNKNNIIKFIFRLIALGICFYGNILTNSTGSYLAIIFGSCCLIFATALFNKKLLKHTLSIFATIFIVTVISVFTGKNPLFDVLAVFLDFGVLLKDTRSPEALNSGTGRWRLWLGAIEFIKDKPIFGYGPDNLAGPYSSLGITETRPHCEPLQFAASLGIPAAVCYLISVITFTVTFFKKKISNPLVIGLVCTVGAYVFSSLFGNTMFYTSPFFFMIFGMATSVLKKA